MPSSSSPLVWDSQQEQRQTRLSHGQHETLSENHSEAAVSNPSSSEQDASSVKARATADLLMAQLHDDSSALPRSTSPRPVQYASADASSSYASDADSEPIFPLLGGDDHRPPLLNHRNSHKWWPLGRRSVDYRRKPLRPIREANFGLSTLRRSLRRLVRHPLFPRQPRSIILTLLTFTIFAICITLLLMHLLNPDKSPLPWRIYCSLPSTSAFPPSPTLSPTDEKLTVQLPAGNDPTGLISGSFPPSNLDEIAPVGVFLAVFSVDSAMERRMLVRNNWASHERSRVGAGSGDGGRGTSRTIVRFVLGKPRTDWERRVQLESETYNDIVELPISENMNSGKSHAFFTWASENAWVPPPSHSPRSLTYVNVSAPPPPHLAPHDPKPTSSGNSLQWVRPDFVAKCDDDAFVMLAELESRLRVQLEEVIMASQKVGQPVNPPVRPSDPLIYWGYLVKNRFMAGELYSLSWSLVNWVASEPVVKTMTRGAEDKQTAKWMRIHPRAAEIRWASERCWIYDHPRAGTVYSHGFLFPSEARRVRKSVLSLLKPVKSIFPKAASSNHAIETMAADLSANRVVSGIDNTTYTLPSPSLSSTPSYSYSSVSRFGVHYIFPIPTFTLLESVEALVEGSEMSQLFEGGPETATQAWARREDRQTRYEGNRVGGTVVVHFIKRNEWFLETALALLGGDEVLDRRPPL